jgi:hypothetical protein
VRGQRPRSLLKPVGDATLRHAFDEALRNGSACSIGTFLPCIGASDGLARDALRVA